MIWSEREARRLVERVFGYATFDDVRISANALVSGNQRFAQTPTTSGDVRNQWISITAFTPDGRHATVRSNRLDERSLPGLVKDVESMAALSPIDPERMPPIGVLQVRPSVVVDPKVQELGAAGREALVAPILTMGHERDQSMSGLVEHADECSVCADRAGLFTYQRRTSVALTTTARTSDGTGSSRIGYRSHTLAGLEPASLASRVCDVAEAARSPQALAPGRTTVVLSSEAVADLLVFLFLALDHREAVEGRSYFSAGEGQTKLGEPLFDARVTLWSEPDNREHPGDKFSSEGIEYPSTRWIENGRLSALRANRYWAHKAGIAVCPFPNSVFLAGEPGVTLDELIGSVDRGVFVQRLFYNRWLEYPSVLATGLTRDGTFLIENGRLKHAVNNFRYNESPVGMLNRLTRLGAPRRTGMGPFGVAVVPPLVVENFNLSSTSDAI